MCHVSLQKRLTLCTRLAISSLDTSRWWGLKVIFMVSGSIFMAFRFGKNQAQLPKRVRGVGLELGHSSTTENQVDGFGLNRAPLPAPLPRMVGPLSMDQRLTEHSQVSTALRTCGSKPNNCLHQRVAQNTHHRSTLELPEIFHPQGPPKIVPNQTVARAKLCPKRNTTEPPRTYRNRKSSLD